MNSIIRVSSGPLTAFCSYGEHGKRFRTDELLIYDDVDCLLTMYGASAEIRERVQRLLLSPETAHFPSGFRYELSQDYRDPERTVVYASLFIPVADAKVKTAAELLEKGGI